MVYDVVIFLVVLFWLWFAFFYMLHSVDCGQRVTDCE